MRAVATVRSLLLVFAVTGSTGCSKLTQASKGVRWSELRDSDPFVGWTTKHPNPNYAVSFEMTVP